MQRNQLSQSSHHLWVLLSACLVVFVLVPMLGHGVSVANEETVLTNPSAELDSERGRDIRRDLPDIVRQDPMESVSMELAGRWITGDCKSIAVRDAIAFCGVAGGLIIVDFTLPDAPVEVARVPLPGSCKPCGPKVPLQGCNSVVLSDEYAYVANSNGGLRIFNISNLANPVEVGFYVTQDHALDVAVTKDHAYVAAYREGLRVIDISNPASPLEVGSYPVEGHVYSVEVSGNYAYVTDFYHGLRVIDVSDPTTPLEVGSLDLGSGAVDVSVSGDYAYVAAYYNGLRVIDIANPAAPVEVGSHDTPMNALNVAVNGDNAYLADYGSFRIFDISDPTSPREIAVMTSRRGSVADVAIGGEFVYIANGRRGARAINVSDPAAPNLVGTHPTGNVSVGVAVSRGHAYVTQFNEGLWVLDVSDPASPLGIILYDNPGMTSGITISGDHAYVYGGVVLRTINIANPTAPVEVGVYVSSAYLIDVVVIDDRAYVANGFDGLRVLDISDPASVTEVGFFEVNRQAYKVGISGNYAYVTTDSSGLRVVDISNPALPQEVGYYDTGEKLYDVVLHGEYAFVTVGDILLGDQALHVLDVSNPAVPLYVGEIGGLPWVRDVVANGADLYVTSAPGGLHVFDVSNPTSPVERGLFPICSEPSQIAVSAGYVYVTDNLNGLYILESTSGGVLDVHLDIKPGSCATPLNVTTPKGEKANGGVLSAAVLGSDALDVRDIDVSSLMLAGAAPLRHHFKDIATPPGDDDDCACSEAGPDGYTDLELKFRRLDVVAGLGSVSGGSVPVTLTGQLKDGTPIEGTDCVRIVPRKGDGGPQLASTNTPAVTALGPATPNPFNPTTTIVYELAARAYMTLRVYDVTGKLVATLVDGEMPGGRHDIAWEASGVASGVYFYRMQTGDFVQTRKMVLLK